MRTDRLVATSAGELTPEALGRLAAESTGPWWISGSLLAFALLGVAWHFVRVRRIHRFAASLARELGQERRLHAELRDSEIALRAGLAGVGQAVLLVDNQMSIRYASPNVTACLGLAIEHVRGQSVGAVFGPEAAARLQTQQPVENLRLALRATGGLRVVRIDARAAPVLGMKWLLACRDVTAEVEQDRRVQAGRRAADEALHLASLGALVSNLAHEINNPNHTIMLNVQVLRSTWLGVIPFLDEHERQHGEFRVANIPYRETREDVPRMVDAVYQSADRIRAIVNGLRDYARDYGRRHMTVVDTSALLHDAAEAMLVHVPDLRGQLRLSLTEPLPAMRGNAMLLQHALLDLLLLAADDGAGARRRRDVCIAARSDGPARVCIEIDGPGQPAQAAEPQRLAQPFQGGAGDNGTKHWRLALATWILQQHHGVLSSGGEDQRPVWRVTFPAVERE